MNIEKIALAGLLHDVGKFSLRALQNGGAASSEAEMQTYGRAHAAHTAAFLREATGDEELVRWAAMHHNPSTHEEKLVRLGDWIASGECAEGAECVLSSDASRLRSIFASLGAADGRAYFPAIEETAFGEPGFFPTMEAADGEEIRTLWHGFRNAIEGMAASGAPTLDSWYFLLSRFTSLLPAATPWRRGGTISDVSLFDHSRMTSAAASALAAQGIDEVETDRLTSVVRSEAKDGAQHLALVAADISGIQPFLYGCGTTRACRSLEGRSFFLNLLGDAVATFLARRAGLPRTAVLYAAGGNALLLLPGSVAARIAGWEEDIQGILADPLEADLTVHVAGLRVTVSDLYLENFRKTGDRLRRRQMSRRNRPLAALARNDPESVFGPEPNSDRGECPVCGRLGDLSIDGDEHPDACGFCRGLEELGAGLRAAEILTVLREDAPSVPGGGPLGLLARLGLPLSIGRAAPSETAMVLGRGRAATPGDLDSTPAEPVSFGYLLGCGASLGGDLTSTARRGGAGKIAMANADIDSLGAFLRKLFRPEGRAAAKPSSLSRLASFSHRLCVFFDGYVPACTATAGNGAVCVIYAGGDDVCLLGEWEATLARLLELRVDFTRYTGGVLTLSAGIAVTSPHFPIRHAAAEAGHAEARAKELRRPDLKDKNAVGLFGATLPWEALLCSQGTPPPLPRVRDVLVRMIRAGAPRSLLHKLRGIQRLYDRERRTRSAGGAEALTWARWRWMLTYVVARAAAREEDRRTILAAITEDAESTRPTIRHLDVALAWAELSLRQQGGKG